MTKIERGNCVASNDILEKEKSLDGIEVVRIVFNEITKKRY